MAAENAAQSADENKAQDTAAQGGDPANAPADGKGGAGGSEGEGGGASEAVSGGATVAGSVADTTGSVAGAAGLDGVAGGAGIASGAAGTTGGAAQIAGGDVAGGASGIATGAGGAATGSLGVAGAAKSGSSADPSQAADGATSSLTGKAESATGAPSSATGAATNPGQTAATAKGAPGAAVSDAKGDAKGKASDAKAAPGAAKDDAKGKVADAKGAPGAAKDDAKGKADGAAEDLGIHKHHKHHGAPDAATGKAGAGGTAPAAAGGSGAGQAGGSKFDKAPAAGDTKAPAAAGDTKAPAQAGDTKAPAAAGDTKAPAAGDTKAPAQAGDTKAPAAAGDTKAPAAGDTKAPAQAGDTKAPAAAGDTKAPAAAGDTKAPAAGDTKAPAAAGDTKAPAADAPAAGDGKAPAAADGKAPAAADGKAPAAAGDTKAPAQAGDTKAPAADGKGAAGGTTPDAAGGKGADQAAPAAGTPGKDANPAAQGGANPAQAGANPAQNAGQAGGETRPPIKASPQANQAVENSPAASQDGGGDGKGPERGVPTPMSLGNIKDLAKLLKDGVDQAKPVLADLKDGKIDLSSMNKIIEFAKSYDKNANVAALKATIEKIAGIAPKALEEGKALAGDIVKGGVTPETAQKILDAVKQVVPGIEKSDFMQKVQGMTDFATDHSAEIKKFQADVAKDGLAPAAKNAILEYAQKAIPGLVPEKFQAAFKTVVDKYKASGGNIDAAINTLKGLFGKSPEEAKKDVAKALGGVLGGALGDAVFKGDKKFLDDIALKLSEATGGKVDANTLKQKLDQQLNDIVKNGRDPREMLRLLVTKMGGFVRGLEDMLLQFGIDAKKILDDVIKALEEFAKKLKEVPEPPKPPKPVRPPVDLFAASAAERYDYFKEVVTDVAKGKWEDAEKQINVVGVRNLREWREVKEEDFFWNDSVVVLWKEGGKKRAEGFLASVDPARRHAEHPVLPAGAAHLVDGHYKYKKIELGLGANKKMYAMPDGEIKFWRDRNRDGERDEEEHIEKGRTQIWVMPGGVQLTGDDFSSGAQVIAGGEKGPWRRFLEILKADTNGSFAYTLVDSARLPAYRAKTLYLPLAAGAKKVPLKPFDPQLGARFNGMYKHVELGEQGGYYPLGLARSWHGGVHALAPQGQDTVVSVASGEVVAARLGAIDAEKHKNGSANFVLVRHKHEKPDAKEGEKPSTWFSLYYHLQPVTDTSLPWVWKIEQEAKKEEEKAEKKKPQAGQDAAPAAGQAAGQNAGQAAPGAKEVDVAEEKEVKHEKKGKVPAGKLDVSNGVAKEALVPTTAPPPPPPPATTEKKLLAEKDVEVPKPAPNVRLAPAKIEWDVETAGMLKGALFLKKIEPARHFTASLSGAFWSYSDFTKGGAPKAGNNGAFGIHKLGVDDKGVIDLELGGGVGVYTVDYYMNGSKIAYPVATCGPSAVSITLTAAAKNAGWTAAGHKLTPPKAVLEQPFPFVQIAGVKASFDVLVDGAKTFSFGAVGLNHVEHVDLGPVTKGNKKLAIQLVPGSGDVGKFGFEAQVEVSKAPQGGAGQQDAGQQQKPAENKPIRLEWDVETEGALKLDVKLSTLEHVALEPIDRILFPSSGHVNYKPHAEAIKPAPAQAGPGQAAIIGGPVNAGFAFATLAKGYPGAVPLQIIAGLGFPHFTADEAEVRAAGQKGGTIEAHLGFIFTDQRPGTKPLVRMKNARGIELITTTPEQAQGFNKDKTLGYAYNVVKVDPTAGVKIFVDGAEKKVETPKLTAGKAWGALVDLGTQKPGAHKVGIELDASGAAIEKWGIAPKFETQPKAPEVPRKDLAYEGQVNSSKSLKVKVTSNEPDKAVKVLVFVDDMTKKEIIVEKKGETAEADLGDLPGAHKLTLVPQAVEGSLGESWKADLVIVTTRKATAEEAELMDNEFAFLVTRGQGGKFEKEFDSKGKVKIKVDFETAGGVKIEYGVGAQKYAAGSPKGGDKQDKDLGRVAAGSAKLTIEGKAADDFGKEPPKDWKPVIKAGAKFKVMLNAVDVKPNNPAEWGTIKPGSGYVVKYNKATGFEAFGFNLGTNALGTHTYAGADPDKGEFTIWGHKFKFDAAGNVTDPKLTKLGQVGKLELLEVPVKGKVTITTEEIAPRKEPEDDKKKDEKPASKSKEALDKAKGGKVGIFEPGAVKIAGGARLGVGSVYGSPGKKKKMIHFEVFSPGAEKPVFDPKADKMGWEYVEDTDANATVDVDKLLKAIDLDKDGTITATEVKAAYGGKGVGPKLRAYVVKHTSEWFTDWKSVLPSSEFWKKMLKDDELKEAANLAQELTWWDGGLSKWDLKDKLVINYHPFRFLQWLLNEQKEAAEASPYHFPAGAAWKLSKNDYEKQFNPPKDGGDGKGGDVHQGPAQGGEDPTAGGDGKGGDGANPAQAGGNAGGNNPAQAGGGGANPAQGGGDAPAGGDGKGGATAPAGGADGKGGAGGDTAPAGGGGAGTNPSQAGGDGKGGGDTGASPAGDGKGDTGSGTDSGSGDTGSGKGDTGAGDTGSGKGDSGTGSDTATGTTDGKGGDGGTTSDSSGGSGAGDTGSTTGKGDTGSGTTGKGDTSSGTTGSGSTGKGDTSSSGGTGTTDGKGGAGGTTSDSSGGSGAGTTGSGTGKGDTSSSSGSTGTGTTGKGDTSSGTTGSGSTGKGDTSSSGGTGTTDGKGGAGGTTSDSSGGSGAGTTGSGTSGSGTGKGDTSSSSGSTGTGSTGKGDTATTSGTTGSGSTGKGDTGTTGSTGSTTGKGDTSSSSGTGSGTTTSDGKGGAGGTTSDSKGGGGAPATTTTSDGKGGTTATTSDGKGGTTATTTDGKGGTTATTTDGKGGTAATTTDGKGTTSTTTTTSGTTATTTSSGTTATTSSSSSSSSGGSSGGSSSKSGVDAAGMIGAGSTGAGSIIGAVGSAAGSGGDGGGKGGAGGEEEGKGGEAKSEEELGTDESKEASDEGADPDEPAKKDPADAEGKSTDEKAAE